MGDGNDVITLTGYRITTTGFEAIDDQQALEQLYEQILLDLRCVIDPLNPDGHEIVDFTQIPEDTVCYPANEFYELLY